MLCCTRVGLASAGHFSAVAKDSVGQMDYEELYILSATMLARARCVLWAGALLCEGKTLNPTRGRSADLARMVDREEAENTTSRIINDWADRLGTDA